MSRKSRIEANRQRHANQQNARHSTGPISKEGKTISSQNSFRHGLTACTVIAIAGEDIQDYIDLGSSLRAEHHPATVTEDALVEKMALGLWLGRRAVNLQERLFQSSPAPDPKLLALYMRYQVMHDRAFSKALNELQAIRNEARRQEVGSVSQIQKQELHAARVRQLNARTEAINFTLNHRKTRPEAA